MKFVGRIKEEYDRKRKVQKSIRAYAQKLKNTFYYRCCQETLITIGAEHNQTRENHSEHQAEHSTTRAEHSELGENHSASDAVTVMLRAEHSVTDAVAVEPGAEHSVSCAD